MLPTGIEYNYYSTPWATLGLIAACGLVFVLQLGASDEVLMAFALQPDRLAPWQWVSSTFMHGGILHLLGNMLFLGVYGRYLEERLGHARFLGLYLALGVGASLVYILASLGQKTPAWGASGAISGIMGVVLIVAPAARVRVVWRYWTTFYAPAWLLLGLWVLEQFWIAASGNTGIAVSAHLGGFALGAAAGALMRAERTMGTGWYLDPRQSTKDAIAQNREEAIWSEIANYHSRGSGPPSGLPPGMRQPQEPTWDGNRGPKQDRRR